MATKNATMTDSSNHPDSSPIAGTGSSAGRKRGGGTGGRGGQKAGRGRGQRAQSAWSGAPPTEHNPESAGGGKGKGKGKQRRHSKASSIDKPQSDIAQGLGEVELGTQDGADDVTTEDVCFICAEPVKYYSVSACNHRTCHVCALRLRALYKKTECTFCKEPQQAVVFTASEERPFEEYSQESMPHRDSKLSILFETQEMMEETLVILRFNCPDPNCDYIGNGWGDLKLHTRGVHNRMMCDLCLRNKKVFAHEHSLYPPNALPIHLPSMTQRHRQNAPKDQVEGGVHPMCEFCRECFFGDDELYAHFRERHEECFVCKRNDVRNQYFQDYNSLERHFHEAHYPCTRPQCLASKFVVFGTVLDLKAHMVEEHGADMTSRDKKDARRVVADFAFEDRHGHDHGRRDHQHERDREPPGPPPGTAPPRQSTSQNRRREAFGARLTDGTPTMSESTAAMTQLAIESDRTSMTAQEDVDPLVAERHAALVSRLNILAGNPTTAVPAVKAAMRGYRSSESSARDLISTVWNVLDRNLENTASIINAFVDLLEMEEKKQDLLTSWNGFAIGQRRQFPELVPTSVGVNYAAITTGRVLNAKHSTIGRSSQKSSRAVWDRVAKAAGSSNVSHASTSVPASGQFPASEKFPPLNAPSSSSSYPVVHPASRGQRTTPWTSSSTVGRNLPQQVPETKVQVIAAPPSTHNTKRSKRDPPKLSSSQFPELPTSSATREKAPVNGNASLRNILGSSAAPAVAAWQTGPSRSFNPVSSTNVANDEGIESTMATEEVTEAKAKKRKGKQKQTLFTLGAFPS